MPFLYPEAGESGPIARAQAVSTPNVLCQPSSYTPDSSFHTTNSPAHPPRAHKLRFFDVRGPEYGPYSPWRFRLVDQQPASGLLDLGILVPSSAILPLAMLEPKYSMVPRLLCSLRRLYVRVLTGHQVQRKSTNCSHNDTEVCVTSNQMHPNEKRRRNTFGFNVLTIFKTIPLMVGYGKQEIIHFRSMHEAFDKSMYDVLQEFAYQTLQDKRRHICVLIAAE